MLARRLFDIYDTYSLRGICMLMIIFHHIYQVFVEDYNYTHSIVSENFGELGTGVFFLLSGYGLWSSLGKRENTKGYLKSSLIKLVKPYVVFFILISVIALIISPIFFWGG